VGIEVRNLSRRFGTVAAADDVSFRVDAGELVALLGPSGSGKSTILRIIAGLEAPDSGSVELDGRPVDHLATARREVGFVFQHYALFRHMTVARNIESALRVRRLRLETRKARVAELLSLVGVDGLGQRYPHQLSGGQRQRVALARALASRPRVLLLDEPFGAIDARIRSDLRQWLRRLHDEVHVTSLLVTHDQEEAFSVADRVIVIHRGRVEQIGRPLEVLDHPATEFVARFVGNVNVFDGRVEDGQAGFAGLRLPTAGIADGEAVRVVVRTDDIQLRPTSCNGSAVVTRMVPTGLGFRVEARMDQGQDVVAQMPRRGGMADNLAPGQRVNIEVLSARFFRR
jgi:sulfate transport system ATP-binding protein